METTSQPRHWFKTQCEREGEIIKTNESAVAHLIWNEQAIKRLFLANTFLDTLIKVMTCIIRRKYFSRSKTITCGASQSLVVVVAVAVVVVVVVVSSSG